MKKFFAFMIAVIILFQIPSSQKVYGLDDHDIVAQSALLMDKNTGRVLFEKNGYEQMAMASTTKIMTCIVALEYGDLNKECLVSSLASRAPEVKLFLHEGESYKLSDLLYALMLESSNDVAVTIAEGVAGSVEAFCNLMTEKANAIGAINTCYKTPNGLDAEGHFTTAYDLALITRYALNNESFNSIINTKSHSFNDTSGKRAFTVNNKNAFLNMYDGANGVKTGFTSKAGYCFVGSVKRGDMELITVVLACMWPPNKTYRWKDTMNLMDYGFENYEYKEVLENQVITFKFEDLKYGIQDEVEGITRGGVLLICRSDEDVDIIYSAVPLTEAPVYQGDIIGQAHVYLDGELYSTINIEATKTIERIDFKYCLDFVLDLFLEL